MIHNDITIDHTTPYVEEGDFIRDPMDGELREVSSVCYYDDEEYTVNFTDGGCMGSDEVKHAEILLPSEVIV